MLYYDRTDISEGIDLANNKNSKQCMIFHYWFYNHWFEFQSSVCNECYHLMLSVDISNIVIVTIENVDYHCIIHSINKSEAINLLKNSVLEDVGIYKKTLPQFLVYSRQFF